MRLSPKMRSAIRRAAHAGRSRCPITVEPGSTAPRLVGEPYYVTFKGSTTIMRCPHYYRNREKDIHYSTLEILVGEDWIAAEAALPDAPDAVRADWIADYAVSPPS